MSETEPLALPRPPRYDPWQTIAETLKRHPGIWHTIKGDATTATTNINDGVLAAFRPAGDYEARRIDGRLEVRYVDDRVEPNPDPASVAPTAGTIECVVCLGTGNNGLGRVCFICRGAGVVK